MLMHRSSTSASVAFVLATALTLASLPAAAQSTLVRLGERSGDPIWSVKTAALDDKNFIAVTRTTSGAMVASAYKLEDDGDPVLLWSAGNGAAQSIAVTTVRSDRFVTAARKSDSTLGLTSWLFSGSGVGALAHASAGAIADVAVAAVGPDRVVTATLSTTNVGKLIIWKLDSIGNFTRKGEISLGAATTIALTAAPPRRVVTAVRDGGGSLKLQAFDITESETFVNVGSITGPGALDAQIVTTAYDRVVTASRLINGDLSIAAWNIAQNGALSAGGSATAGGVIDYSLTAVGTARVATSTKTTGGSLKLITWQVVDEVKRLDSETAGAFFTGSATTLGYDRIVTALRLNNDTLKIISWGELSTGVLYRMSGPIIITPFQGEANAPEAGRPHRLQTRGQSPPPIGNPIFPDISGVDPMLAVGPQFIIASQDHWLRFLDKSGNNLPSKWGEPTKVSTGELFRLLWQGFESNGSINRQNINLHLDFPLLDRADMACIPFTNTPMTPCMDEIYDTKVYYDQYIGRFIILGAVRHFLFQGTLAADGTPYLPIVRRYLALAVSRTKDPRDGFHQYMLPESDYADYPQMGVANGVLVINHDDPKGTSAREPAATVFATADLAVGSPEPRNFKLYPYQTEGGKLVPVNHFGSTSGFAFLVKPRTDGIQVFNLAITADLWDNPPASLPSSFAALAEALSGRGEGITFRNNALHLIGMKKMSDRQPNVATTRWSIRLLRFPLVATASGPELSTDPADGFLDKVFGKNGPGDAAGDLVSYEKPGLAVNTNGDMLISYGRVPVDTAQPLPQEVRYSVLYNDSRGLQESRLFKAGELVLMDTHPDDTVALPVSYAGIWRDQLDAIDFSFACVDPADDLTLWFAHEYAAAGSDPFKLVIGRVLP